MAAPERQHDHAGLRVLGNRQLQHELGARGRATAERLYSWEAIGRPMLNIYLEIARGHSQIPPVSDSAVGRQAHA